MNNYFVDKELYDNTEANFNDLTIKYEHLEKVADERMSTILDIEKYCIDEKEDLISGCEVCEDILKIIEQLKSKKYYINHTFTKREIEKLQQSIDKVIEDLKGTLKINRHYIEETKYGKNEWICMDIDHIQELIDMLEEVKENK